MVKAVYQKGKKRMVEKLDYVCGSLLVDYVGTVLSHMEFYEFIGMRK